MLCYLTHSILTNSFPAKLKLIHTVKNVGKAVLKFPKLTINKLQHTDQNFTAIPTLTERRRFASFLHLDYILYTFVYSFGRLITDSSISKTQHQR
jgi:hypothetical protein